jgi:hypothetical protein
MLNSSNEKCLKLAARGSYFIVPTYVHPFLENLLKVLGIKAMLYSINAWNNAMSLILCHRKQEVYINVKTYTKYERPFSNHKLNFHSQFFHVTVFNICIVIGRPYPGHFSPKSFLLLLGFSALCILQR